MSAPGTAAASHAASDAADLPRAASRRALGVLLHELGRRPLLAAACVLVLLAGAVVGTLVPVGIGVVVDVVDGSRPRGDVVLALVLLAASGVGAALAATLATSLAARVTEPALGALRERALARVLHADVGRVESSGSGQVVARLTADVERLAEATSGTIEAFVVAGLAIVTSLVGLAVIDWRFAVAGLLAAPLQAWTLRWYLRASAPVYRDARAADATLTQRLLDAVRGAAAARALRQVAAVGGATHDASAAAVVLEARTVRLSTRFYGRLNVAEAVGLSAVLAVGFVVVRSGSATVGAATTAALLFVRLFDPVNTVLGLFDAVQQAAASLTRVVGLGDLVPGSSAGDQPWRATVRGPLGAVLDDVHVGYGAGAARRTALRGVTLRVAPGERVVVVGASGAGKTTVARLLAGQVEPAAGSVRLHDASGVPAGTGGVVLLDQHPHLFTGTLAQDLRLVAPDADDDRLAAAARVAGIRLGTGTFADGLGTVVAGVGAGGGAGVALSAADAQRVALARVVLADPGLVVLDEASADAGALEATELEAAIDRVVAGRTAVVVAHRLASAPAADRVVVLDDGRVRADGPHDALVLDDPVYAALWAAWSGDTVRGGAPTSSRSLPSPSASAPTSRPGPPSRP